MKKESDLKLVRISRKAGQKLTQHICNLNSQFPLGRYNAGRWLDQAIFEKVAREHVEFFRGK